VAFACCDGNIQSGTEAELHSAKSFSFFNLYFNLGTAHQINQLHLHVLHNL